MSKEIIRQYKFDKNNNEIYYKSSAKYEEWKEYDENNNLTHWKSFDTIDNEKKEKWYRYNKNNEKIRITEKEFNNIK